ncbi:MAG: hypothetical protein DWQ34_25875 [Planctomycetota bacterium]|mgnify:FL=1|nr:MAG: hypothetical protein DWQ34_25875 [Planctomycetota bacterium]REK25856.1 MAG: hypothetical protein DWQ41_11090 [Planctomycetota bacterium]REK37135.1 MAG: hypothetical protein DWQ45_07900 [Planctomycetota bacterium]
MNDIVSSADDDPSSVLSSYRPTDAVFDEFCDADGAPRPHWAKFLGQLDAIGRDEFLRRWEQAKRQIASDGVTFNPHDADGGGSRPWAYDAIPILLHESEWTEVTSALEQRAHLLELILGDLFGPQRLLKDRILPPDLLFGHPGFYPAYCGLTPPGQKHLTLYAADLARAPDGKWWVMGDRTRAPSGLGYALENRVVTSRVLPAAFRRCQVQRLAPFFIAMKEQLRELAMRARDNPRILLWSKGSESRSYFEDAYLARYLGYTLVEGGDLAVRNGRVMLKTLGGLLPVEVLLRRMNDDDCDSVELNPASTAGVSGLLEIVRSGAVAIANPLGSRLVESPILQAFLPGVCRHLLGEELKMSSIATWWCGQPEARQYVFDHLDQIVIRPAFRTADDPPIHPTRLSAAERDELIAAINSRPEQYVGQETVMRSTTPVMTDDGPAPWHVALRSFLVSRDYGYTALPGALARVAPDAHDLDFVMTAGERSQDVWILSDAPTPNVSLLPVAEDHVVLRRAGSDLPSRVADNFFWLGRYVERAEGSIRLLRTVLELSSSETEQPEMLHRLYRALAELGQIEPDYVIDDLGAPLPDVGDVLLEAVFDDRMPRSLRSTIAQAERLVSTVRDRVSVDAWRAVHKISQASRRPQFDVLDSSDVLELLNKVLTELLAFAGLAGESMTRTQGWRFLDLGRRVERAWQTSTLLNAALTQSIDDERPLLDAILQAADSIMTYRSRYLASVQIAAVLDLLILDESSPRSIAFQLRAIEDHVGELPRDAARAGLSAEQRLAVSLRNAVRLADVYELVKSEGEGERPQLERLLMRLINQLPKLADAVSSRFLIHAGQPRHYGARLAADVCNTK